MNEEESKETIKKLTENEEESKVTIKRQEMEIKSKTEIIDTEKS